MAAAEIWRVPVYNPRKSRGLCHVVTFLLITFFITYFVSNFIRLLFLSFLFYSGYNVYSNPERRNCHAPCHV